MLLHPGVYADMLIKRMNESGAKVWLINTGWTGGPYGIGHRISLKII
jgi:phosphoenolpyruvate carboxykinase (ATP)